MNINKALVAIAFALAAAGATHPAHAVSLNPRGLGQVLIYPYYTVNKGQDTLLSAVNASAIGKVVKVNLLEGYNGRPVADFWVFLSPHDVWTARISQRSDDGGAALFTNDHSCTLPAIPAGGLDFSNVAYVGGSGSTYPADGGPTGLVRTREGSIEFIAAADIVPGSALDAATTHFQNGTPNGGVPACTPSALGSLGAANNSSILAPSSGLFGAGSIINVGSGTFFGYAAEAIGGFTDRVMITPSEGLPDVRLDGAHSSGSASPTGAIASVPLDNGQLLTLDYARGIDAVSAVFMADAINNEFLVSPEIGANTDWIVTFPTKRFYTDKFYTGSDRALAPFEVLFQSDGEFQSPGMSNILFDPSPYDREEGSATAFCGFPECPGLPPNVLAYEVNVISFLSGQSTSNPSGVFGSMLNWNLPPFGDSGWVHLDLYPAQEPHILAAGMTPAGAHVALHGLPVAGFMVYNIINANAQPGKLANYGGLFPHRASVSCSTVNAPAPAQDPCS